MVSFKKYVKPKWEKTKLPVIDTVHQSIIDNYYNELYKDAIIIR